MVYGNFTTLPFDDVNTEEMLVIALKRKIFMRLKLQPKDQRLSVRLHGDLREMENHNSLSAYLITDKTPIFLENTLLGLQGFESVATEQELYYSHNEVKTYFSELLFRNPIELYIIRANICRKSVSFKIQTRLKTNT
jgi:hypothetical protein